MNDYIVLFRGINVGGKNKVSMADLRGVLEKAGFHNVQTYIASGNVILESDKNKKQIKEEIEKLLPTAFKLDSDFVKVLVLSPTQADAVIKNKPTGFGEQPEKYHSDVAFLIDITIQEAADAFVLREGVDTMWQGDGVVYFQRLSAERTKSKLSKIVASPLYKSLTIRNWNTTLKLTELVKERQNAQTKSH